MSNSILLLLLLLILKINYIYANQKISEGPVSTTARIGETVILKCRVENQEGAVQWLKNGFGLGSKRDLPLFPRYSMIGRSSLGEYHLQIENATFNDEANYECHIEETSTSASQTSSGSYLQIISEPQPPLLLTNKTKLSLEEGKNVDLTCQSIGGRPAAQLTWVILRDRNSSGVETWISNSSEILKNYNFHGNRDKPAYTAIIKNENKIDENGLETVSSRILFPVSKLEDGKYLACIAIHPTFGDTYKIVTIPMNILYAPAVEIKLDESRSTLEEGGQAVLTCNAEAKPSDDLQIYWTKNGEPLEPTGRRSVVLRNLRMEDHQDNVICHARNIIGNSTASYKLNINFGPRIMSTSQTKVVQRGESVTFICEATGNPKPLINWIRKSDTDMVISKGNRFRIDSVQPWQVGQYDCVASVPGFTDMVVHNYLHIKGPPTIEFYEDLIKHDSDKVTLICHVKGKPFPKNVIWHKDGKPINFDLSKGRIQSQEIQKEFGIESKLTITRVTQKDYGIYNCSAENEYGSHSMSVKLTEITIIQKLINYGVNSLAVLALVLLCLIILLFILLCCVKKNCCRNKKTSPFNNDPSDVTVRCEALDGVQYFGDIYTSNGIDNGDIISSSKDYISIPQNNPDLDYLPPPNVIYQTSHGYVTHHSPNEYAHSENSLQGYEPTFNSFLPNGGHVIDVYGNSYAKHSVPGQLETLTEVATPDTESGTPLLLSGENHERVVSQMSTHV